MSGCPKITEADPVERLAQIAAQLEELIEKDRVEWMRRQNEFQQERELDRELWRAEREILFKAWETQFLRQYGIELVEKLRAQLLSGNSSVLKKESNLVNYLDAQIVAEKSKC